MQLESRREKDRLSSTTHPIKGYHVNGALWRVQRSGPAHPTSTISAAVRVLGDWLGEPPALVPFLLILLANALSPGFSTLEQGKGSPERTTVQMNDISAKDSSGCKEYD